MLDLEMSAVAWMMQCFPEVKEIDDMRKSIGRYGLSGKQQASVISVWCCLAGVLIITTVNTNFTVA